MDTERLADLALSGMWGVFSHHRPIIKEALDALVRAGAIVEPMSYPEGWKIVPVEPTREMWAASGTAVVRTRDRTGNHDDMSAAIWAAMLAAAPLETSADTFAGKSEGAEKLGVLDCRSNSSDAPIDSDMSSERAS